MAHLIEEAPQVTIGLDLGDVRSQVCELDERGNVRRRSSTGTRRSEVRSVFGDRPRCRVALEVGTHSPWVSRLLDELGHEVFVANPRKLRMIYASEAKTDRRDAELLARVARMDPELLSPIQHRPALAQLHRCVLSSRRVLVEARTRLINHVRGVVKAWGERLPRCTVESFPAKVVRFIPEALRGALTATVDEIASLNSKIRAMDREVRRLCDEVYPETRRLRQVAGVGELTSLCFVLTIEDPSRFAKSREVAPYLGLVPRRRESGASSQQLGITKTGDSELRKLLVQAAQYALGPFGPDCELRRWGLQLAERGGPAAKKRAIIATARKLSILLHRLWVSGEEYRPLERSRI